MVARYSQTMPDMAIDRRHKIRREDDREGGFDRDDIFLLLESYRNTIELNTTLLERQDVLNQSIEPIKAELANICSNQAQFSARLTEILKEFENSANDRIERTGDQYDTIRQMIDQNRAAETTEHSNHTMRLHAAIAAMGSIIIGLIGLVAKLWIQ